MTYPNRVIEIVQAFVGDRTVAGVPYAFITIGPDPTKNATSDLITAAKHHRAVVMTFFHFADRTFGAFKFNKMNVPFEFEDGGAVKNGMLDYVKQQLLGRAKGEVYAFSYLKAEELKHPTSEAD